MAASYRDTQRKTEARKLRELFKGRFSEEESVELLREQGDLSEAVDFILKGDPEKVRRYIHDRNKALVDNLRRDSADIQNALNQGVDASVRLFACQDCDIYWWRKVPVRKEVSKCRICKTRYDPVPRDQEWGLAQFSCYCGNTFWGAGWMNHTQSPCYNCRSLACPSLIVPPVRARNQKKRANHSCTGTNCYNRAQAIDANGAPVAVDVAPHNAGSNGGGPRGRRGGGGRKGMGEDRGGDAGVGEGSVDDVDGYNLCAEHRQLCPHERSIRKRKVLYPSSHHVSTGSTVNTFMSQGELAEVYEDLESLPGLPEEDEY